RRHTRYIGYWSSDVCSSDLLKQRPEIQLETRRFLGRRPEFLAVCRVVVSLHCLLCGKVIGGMRWGGGTVERQEEGRATVLRQIRSLFQVGAFGDLTDGQLLERFMTGHKESAEMAFTALVEW